MRKNKTFTRAYYKNKFKQQFKDLCYIPQENEEIRQCKAPYPKYWFLSNKGYLFSAFGANLKLIKPYYKETGIKDKNGNRTGYTWEYQYKVKGKKHNQHIIVHKLMCDTFLENEFDNYDEPMEIHHKRKKNKFNHNQSQFCNRAVNLQLLPRSIHKELTKYTSKTMNDFDKEIEDKIKKSGCPIYQFTEEQLEMIMINAIQSSIAQGGQPILYTTSITDDISNIEGEAHPIKNVEIIDKSC